MKTTITKRFNFCYGHFLPNHPGKCKNQHGHNAELEVTVSYFRGGLDEMTGMVFDFGDLKKVVSPILELLDHRYLNGITQEELYSFVSSAPPVKVFSFTETPTAENIALFIFEAISESSLLPDHVIVQKIRLSETPDSWVEVTEE